MRIDAIGTFSKEDGTLMIDMEFHPATEIEHEIIAEFVRHPKRTLVFPTKLVVDRTDPKNPITRRVPTQEMESDLLHVRLELDDEDAFDAAVHNLENRKRAAEGRPSLEEEADRKAAAEAAMKAPEEQSQADAKKQADDLAASRDRIERMAATEIANRVTPAAPTPTPAPGEQKPEQPKAKEPNKVQ